MTSVTNFKKEIYKDLADYYIDLQYVIGQNNYEELSSADQERVQKAMELVRSDLEKRAGGLRGLFK